MNREVYKHLLRTYGRNPGYWFGVVMEGIRTFLLRIVSLILVARITTSIVEGNVDGAKRLIVLFLVNDLAGAVFGLVGDLVAVRAENDEYERLTVQFHKKLTSKDMSFYRDSQTGYLSSAFRQYLDGCMLLVRFFRVDFLRVAVSLTAPIVVLLFAEWRIGLVAVGIVAIQAIYIFWASSKATEYRKASHEIYRKITAEVSDEVTNIVAFKSGGIEHKANEIIHSLSKQETEAFWQRRKNISMLDLPRGVFTTFGIVLALYMTTVSAAGDATAIGLVVLSLTYMFQINRNVMELPKLITEHDDLITKIQPPLAYLSDENEAISDPEDPKPLVLDKAKITIQNVGFSYPSHSGKGKRIPVFNDLSLEIGGGEQVGIVGLSGAGKSTLASLLMRFDDIESGSIQIDGTDIREVRQSELRQHIAYVPQEPLLFHRTIGQNIAYFNDKATKAQIIKAAKAAHIHNFINGLPDGYDTVVGERGIKLSGGQKQRVVIARAILKNASIMLFDEATSALDSESEQIIQQALPEILGKQTALIIAHRLSTVAGLDRIIVMHHGKVVEQGGHKELLKYKGRYYDLWQKQTRGE